MPISAVGRSCQVPDFFLQLSGHEPLFTQRKDENAKNKDNSHSQEVILSLQDHDEAEFASFPMLSLLSG